MLVARSAAAGSLTYDAPAGCPSQEDVAGRAARRAPDARDAVVAIQKKKASGYAAHLSIGGGDDTLERDVEGRTCDGVVDAALLVLSLDRAPEPPPPVAAAPIVPAADTPAVAPREPNEPARKPIAIAVGLDVESRTFLGGGIYGGTLFGELSAPGLFGWTRFRPSVRLGASFLSGGDDTRFIGVTAEICPLGVDVVSSRRVDLTLSACGILHGGSAHEFTTGSWFDAGGLARAKVQVGPRGHVRVFFELSAGIVTPLGNDNTPEATVDVIDVGSTPPPALTASGIVFPEPGRYEGIIAIGGGIVFP